MNEVGFCPVVSGVLSSGILSCGVLSIHREGLVILCMAATSKLWSHLVLIFNEASSLVTVVKHDL